jgi:hypothetical protein
MINIPYGMIKDLIFFVVNFMTYVNMVFATNFYFGLMVISIITLLLYFTGEVLSLLRYIYYKNEINHKIPYDILRIDNQELVKKYCDFMKKHIMNDKFSDIYETCYPNQSYTEKKIHNTIKYYLFNLYPDYEIPHDNVEILKTINYLTKILTKKYVMADLELKNKNDETFVPFYKNQIKFKYFYEYICDAILSYFFIQHMNNNNFISIQITDNIKIWKHKSSNTCHRLLYFIDEYNFIEELNRTYIYIEIKNLTRGNEFYELLSQNYGFNKQEVIDDMEKVFYYLETEKISLELSNINTMFLPNIIAKYDANIKSLFLMNPICYPYSYHNSFTQKKNKYNDKIFYGEQCLLNQSSLIDNFRKNILLSKESNKMYSHKTHIILTNNNDDNNKEYHELLETNLGLYSEIRIIESNKKVED